MDRLEERLLLSVAIDVRYTYDNSGFFDLAPRRAAMERAADYVESFLEDTLSSIQASGANTWSALLTHPSTGVLESIANLSVAANTLVVFVGARDLPGAEKANGGPGGFSASGSQSWLDVVAGRGQPGSLLPTPTDTSPWGGSVTFDSIGTNWYFGESEDQIQSNQIDFFSVAIHELAHVLGFGIQFPAPAVTSWSRFVSGGLFTGPHSMSANGSVAVPLDPGRSHWAESVRSQGQETAMAPTLLQGTRKLFTALDLAGLADLGWTIRNQDAIQFASAEFVVAEDAGAAQIILERPSGGSAATVRLRTVAGTATAGLDYHPLDTTISFAPGERTKSVALTIFDDSLFEGIETAGLTLSDFQGAEAGYQITATLTILDREKGASNDYDGNGVTDLGVFNIATAIWNVQLEDSAGNSIGSRERQYGIPGNFANQVGLEAMTDFPIPGDYNGDGITDRALFRIATAEYFVQYLDRDGGIIASRSYQFGFPGNFAIANGLEPLVDIPIPGDYNGDGVYDLAVFRVPTAEWIIRLKQPGFDFAGNLIPGPGGARVVRHGIPGTIAEQFGLPILTDIPVPGDYDGNGVTDFAVYRRLSEDGQLGHWLIRFNDEDGNRIGTRGFAAVWELSDDPQVQAGAGAIEVNIPVPGDFDGNGVTDLAIWHTPTGEWRIILIDEAGQVVNRLDDGSSNTRRQAFGAPGGPAARSFPDVPLHAPISSLIKIGLLPGIPGSRFSGGATAHRMASSAPAGSRILEVNSPVPIVLRTSEFGAGAPLPRHTFDLGQYDAVSGGESTSRGEQSPSWRAARRRLHRVEAGT